MTNSASNSPDRADDNGPNQGQFNEDLRRAAEGNREARNRLWAEHYDTLHQCAKTWLANQWRRRGADFGVSLDGTDIVNLAYERMHDRTAAMVNGRAYFFRAFYTECMRIVVDHYRKTKNDKGRGAYKRVEMQSELLQEQGLSTSLDMLYDILSGLEKEDSRAGQVAMLKVFENRPVEGKPGAMRSLTNSEVAEMLGIGLRTVEQDWKFAKAYLLTRLDAKKPQ